MRKARGDNPKTQPYVEGVTTVPKMATDMPTTDPIAISLCS